MSKICIYHGNCTDGFAAAWAVNQKYKEENIVFKEGLFGSVPPDVTGMDVIIVDFSYSRKELSKLCRSAKSILLMDHHLSSFNDLLGLDDEISNLTLIFDMERCGCQIAWDHYFPDVVPPKVFDNIADRDLLKYKLLNTRYVSAYAFSSEYSFQKWDWIMDEQNYDEVVTVGEILDNKVQKNVVGLANHAQIKLYRDMPIVVANAPEFYACDLARVLLDSHSKVAFAAIYYVNGSGKFKVSLRSCTKGINVEEVATRHGGGGHRNASGFIVDNLPWETVMEEGS